MLSCFHNRNLKFPVIQIWITVLWCGYLYFEKTQGMTDTGKIICHMINGIPFFFLLYYGARFFRAADDRKAYICCGLLTFITVLFVRGLSLVSEIGFSFSFGFLKDYCLSLFQLPEYDCIESLYLLCIIFCFAPFFSKLVSALSEKEKIIALWIVGGYFLFFTVEIFIGFVIRMMDIPFHNVFGYLLGYQLLISIHQSPLQKKVLTFLFLLSGGLMFLFLCFYPSADEMNDTYFVFKMILTIGCYHILTFGKALREEINILPIVMLTVYFWERFI